MTHTRFEETKMSGSGSERRKGYSSGCRHESCCHSGKNHRKWKQNVTVKAYPNLNHLFQTCEKGTLAEYGQLEETINPEVLKDIIEWIRKQ